MTQTPRSMDTEGLATFGMCKSLVLALTDLKVLSEGECRGIC